MPRSPAPLLLRKPGPIPRAPTTGRPRLWNAHRRIETCRGLTPVEYRRFLREPNFNWRKYVSQDVKDFIEENSTAQVVKDEAGNPQTDEHGSTLTVQNFPRSQLLKILKNPAKYFRYPSNVPVTSRQRVFFPNVRDAVVLRRTRHLGPRYAAFDVPLHFNKLDMRAYLKSLYDVDVLHVRSAVKQSKVKRRLTRPDNPEIAMRQQGRLYRPASRKQMTCQLVVPFVWPEEIKDLKPWDHELYWKTMKRQREASLAESEYGVQEPDKLHRQSLADQARNLYKGESTWAPSWKLLPMNEKVMKGRDEVYPSARTDWSAKSKQMEPTMLSNGAEIPLRPRT